MAQEDRKPATCRLVVGEHCFSLEMATTVEQQTKGLGGRRSMAEDRGMLFVFQDMALRRVWMKDTHLALDIIWLDADKRIQHIESNVSPDTYPRIFSPVPSSQYIIELNAGQAARAGLYIGQKLSF